MKRRICPNCGSKTTKIVHIIAGTSTCRICKHVEYLRYSEQIIEIKKINIKKINKK